MSFQDFKELFDPVIDARHAGYPADAKHPTDLDASKVNFEILIHHYSYQTHDPWVDCSKLVPVTWQKDLLDPILHVITCNSLAVFITVSGIMQVCFCL